MGLKNASHRKGLICVLLAVLTLAAYCPVLRNNFVNYDDNQYITQNRHVLTGLSWANVKWAFTTGYASNWHPLTWLSHQLDAQIFGLRPQWHHLENLLFHVANSILLFLVLLAATGGGGTPTAQPQASNAKPEPLWRCFFVAALFAVHPLHVESVAWAAERKDVLSTFFFLLTVWAYVRYAQAREAKPPAPDGSVALPGSAASGRLAIPRYYALALLCYAFGLMSKPMLVTAPFVLLLLDYWPLGRLSLGNPNSEIKIHKSDIADSESAKFLALRSFCKLVGEKIPFFLLAAASSLITFLVQRAGHSTSPLEGLPLEPRVTNTLIAYLRYVGKIVWPAKLAAFYPHPGHWGPAAEPPEWMVCGAALALVAITVWVTSRRKQQAWLAVGWFWYVGTLVPVIGLVQVGAQAIADRYMYIPSIGLFIAAVWWVDENIRGEHAIEQAAPVSAQGLRTYALGVAGVVLVIVEAVLANTQVRYWHDTFSLFQHTAAVTKNNQVALLKLSDEYATQGKPDLALKYVRMSLEADPNFDIGYYTLGLMAVKAGNLEEAVEDYQNGLKISPWNAKGHMELGVALLRLGRTDEAGEQLMEAARLSPNSALVHYNLGLVYAAREQHSQAAAEFAEAARLHADADTLAHLSGELLALGRLDEAETRCHERVRLDPKNPEAHQRLATVLQVRGKLDQALESFNEAVRLKPGDLAAQIGLGRTFALQGKFAQAQTQFRQANQLAPTNTDVLLLLGDALMAGGQTNESAAAYATALKLDPDLAHKKFEAGKQLAAKGQLDEAGPCLLTATLLNPKDADAHQNLGELLSQQGRLDEGAKELQSAIRLCLTQDHETPKPQPQTMLAHAYYDLAMVRSLQGRPNEAVDCYRYALGVDTNYLAALNNLAWLLATDPHDAVRNGAEAVRLAEHARDLSGGKEARYWGTLDAAYAEARRWSDATRAVQKTIELAESAGQKDLADAARNRLALYQEQKPFRQ